MHNPSRLLLIPLLFALAACSQPSKTDPYVVILSIDGCRWDYPMKANMTNLHEMAKKGVRAEAIIPSYPTKTLPNHYSMATGLYPDHHGIVQNNFYDPDLGLRFTMGNRDRVQDSIFWEGEAIWETAQKQGVNAASFYWVGTETNEYFKPSIRKYFDDEVPFETRIDSVISWLYLPESKRPRLLMFYFEEPDGVGHNFGPDAPETIAMLGQLDGLIGKVRERLRIAEKDLKIRINFVVTSDHGMAYIPQGQYVFLTDYIHSDQLDGVAGGNPVWMLQPKAELADSVFNALKAIPHLKVWKKQETPAHYHYGTHKRIFDLVVEAEAGWGLEMEKRRPDYSLGTHGYDPANQDMHAIFYATGPAFKKGYVHPAFENVNLYSLLAELLSIEPALTDGSLEAVSGMLKPKRD